MHAGNYFTLLLREVNATGARHADKCVAAVRKRGFINYYGHQRFGLGMRSSMPTVEVLSSCVCVCVCVRACVRASLG